MHDLKYINDRLIEKVRDVVSGDLESICTAQLGEVIDMIKDMTQAIYYHTITEAMGKNEKNPVSTVAPPAK